MVNNVKQHFAREIELGTKSAILKKKIITHYIYNGNSTITDLSKELDLSVPTITKFVSEMCDDGYIHEVGKLETSGGRYPSLYGLNRESGYFIGVDVKQFGINIGLMDFRGDMVQLKMNIPYRFQNSIGGLNDLCDLINCFIHEYVDQEKLLNININLSGRVNSDSGYSFSQFNFDEHPLADVMAERLGYEVVVDNDTRAMAYGEYMSGCVQGEKDMLFVNISWGLGLGLVLNGKVYKGKSGFSGELGHVPAFENEIICHCGKKGCLETEASGSALYRILLERINNGENSILSKRIKDEKKPITLEDIVACVNKEDSLCIEIIEEIGGKLGRQIAGLINLFNPDLVVIGGTLSLTKDFILQPIRTSIRKYSLNLVNKDTTVQISKLNDRAGIVGACMLARSKIFDC